MLASSSAVDAIVSQSRRALQLPDSTFRTEYDINNAMAANIERLQAAASMAPTRVAELDELCTAWRTRAAQWKVNNHGTRTFLATTQDFVEAMDELDADPANAADAGKAPKRRRAKDKKDKKATKADGEDADDVHGGGQRHGGDPHMERGASLDFYLHGAAAAPNPRAKGGSNTSSPALTPRTSAKVAEDEDEKTRGPCIYSETLRDPPVLVTSLALPEPCVSSQAAIRLVPNSANAVLVFDRMASPSDASSSPEASPSASAKGGKKSKSPSSRSPRTSRPNTPRPDGASSPPPPEELERCNVDARVTLLRSVLRAIIHLAGLHLQAHEGGSKGAAPPLPILGLDVVRAVLPTITIGTQSKLPKALRAPKGSAAKLQEEVDAASDDDASTGMPTGPNVATVEYQHADGGDEDGGDGDLDDLSSQLVAEYERQAAEERQAELLAGDAGVGRTGLPLAVPPFTMAVALPTLRDAPMAVLMCHGGCFAGGIFIAGTALVHKTFERYVVRKKQGGKQSAQGAGTNSAGSQIRKMQETKWREDVKCILDEWRPLLDSCWVIAYVAPGPDNKKILTDFTVDWQPRVGSALPPPVPEVGKFFERCKGVFLPSNALASPVDILNDPRVMSAPLTTHKPTYAEVERVYAALRSMSVQRMYRTPIATA